MPRALALPLGPHYRLRSSTHAHPPPVSRRPPPTSPPVSSRSSSQSRSSLAEPARLNRVLPPLGYPLLLRRTDCPFWSCIAGRSPALVVAAHVAGGEKQDPRRDAHPSPVAALRSSSRFQSACPRGE